jgi:hypothetical protein
LLIALEKAERGITDSDSSRRETESPGLVPGIIRLAGYGGVALPPEPAKRQLGAKPRCCLCPGSRKAEFPPCSAAA